MQMEINFTTNQYYMFIERMRELYDACWLSPRAKKVTSKAPSAIDKSISISTARLVPHLNYWENMYEVNLYSICQ